jgi:D-3-phosphoglycerate dehydrogenase
MQVRGVNNPTPQDFVNVITLRGGDHVLAGTLVGLKQDARIVQVDDHTVDVPPSPNMLVVRNDDRPGVIGRVGTILGRADVNIDDMVVGRSPDGDAALMVIATSVPVSRDVLAEIEAAPGVTKVRAISARSVPR